MTLRESLDTYIQSLSDVEQRKSRFSDIPAYYVGRREFAHFHGAGVVDIRLTRAVICELELRQGDDPRVGLRGSSDWIEYHFRRKGDLDRARELLERAYAANLSV